MNRRGAGEGGGFKGLLGLITVVGVVFVAIATFSYFTTGQFGFDAVFRQEKIIIAVQETISFEAAFGNGNLVILTYIFGRIPTYQVDATNLASAVIILIGVWLLLFLTFGDILSLFGTFSTPISWFIALILAIVAANLKFVVWLSIVGLVLASGLGAIAVFVNLIGIFIVFILFNYGSNAAREWVLHRKISSLKLRSAMGNAKVLEALKALKQIDESLFRGEK